MREYAFNKCEALNHRPAVDDENVKYELIIFVIVQRPPIFYLPSHQILSNIIIAFLIFFGFARLGILYLTPFVMQS